MAAEAGELFLKLEGHFRHGVPGSDYKKIITTCIDNAGFALPIFVLIKTLGYHAPEEKCQLPTQGGKSAHGMTTLVIKFPVPVVIEAFSENSAQVINIHS